MSESLEFTNVERAAARNLRAAVPSAVIKEERIAGSASQGEPATVTVIVTLAAISAVAAWLMKYRKSTKIDQEVIVATEDGRRIEKRIRITIDESKTTEETVKFIEHYLNQAILDS